MFPIESHRLEIMPLSAAQIQLLINKRKALESSLGLKHNVIDLPADFTAMMQESFQSYILPKINENPREYPWFTHWLVIHKAERVCIGGIGGSGLPDENGEVTIGYYIDRKYEKKGYASEATRLFVSWLLQDHRLKKIVATIPVGHSGSERVVVKNGFTANGILFENGMRLQRWVLEK